MLGKFNSFIEKWMAFVTPACLLMGVLFPDIAKHGVPYVTYAFAFMTFIGALKSRFRDVADVFKKPLPLILMLLVLHVLVPGDCLWPGTSFISTEYELYHRDGSGIFCAYRSDQSDVGVYL